MHTNAVYIGFHFAQKVFRSMHHTIFVVLSTIFWIVSGVLIHTLFGLIQCGGNECHELKIIEVLSWVLAGMSIVASVPVVSRALVDRKHRMERKKHGNKDVEKGTAV
ncbi:hypothetical protein C8R44DRAFT_808848 [Mycena epipterygia]|nr:hypothetical protein C8R44DRAFT_808848 [Mycena epipterygia]